MIDFFQANATGYHPVNEDDPEYKMEGGKVDRLGNPIFTLDQFRRGEAPFVTVAMDATALPYGTPLSSPDFPDVPFKVADTGSAFKGKGFSKIDIARDTAEGANHPENNGKFTFQIAGAPIEVSGPVQSVTPNQGVMPDMSALSIGGPMPTLGEVSEIGLPDIAPPTSSLEGLGILAPIGEPGAQPIDTSKPAPTPIPKVLPTHTKVVNPDGSITIPETGTTWYKEGFMIKTVNGRPMKIDSKGRQSWVPQPPMRHQLADFTDDTGKPYKALVDIESGDVIKKLDDPGSRPMMQAENLRLRMLNSAKTQPGIVAYVNVKNNYDSLAQNAAIPPEQRTGADDAAAIQAFGAIEHPGTGVTDADKKQAAGLVPLWDSLLMKGRNFFQNKANALTPEVVSQMRDAAKRALDGRQKTYNDELAPLINEAQRVGLKPEEVNGALGANVVDSAEQAQAPANDKYEKGKVYRDASGKTALYLGDGHWQEQ